MLKPLSPQQGEDLRDSIEETLESTTYGAMRSWLSDVRGSALAAVRDTSVPNTLLAAAPGEVPPLGEFQREWAEEVDNTVMPAVAAAFERAYRRYTDRGESLDDAAMEGARQYLSWVRNRIVEGTHMGVTAPEEALDRIRASLAASVAEGWTRNQLARRIAADLSWDKDAAYWEAEKQRYGSQIDNILDPIGPPGNPAREAARLNDPRVRELQAQMALATKRLDAIESVWRTRANLIARTESTGVTNYGAYRAFQDEGVLQKMWVATADNRTRLSHRTASGQSVGLDDGFMVGGYRMLFPGDPGAPIQEVAGCRCTMVADENLTPEQRKQIKAIAPQ